MYTGPAQKKAVWVEFARCWRSPHPAASSRGAGSWGAGECRVGPVSLLFAMQALAQGATLKTAKCPDSISSIFEHKGLLVNF